jgi:hypothetical protein
MRPTRWCAARKSKARWTAGLAEDDATLTGIGDGAIHATVVQQP